MTLVSIIIPAFNEEKNLDKIGQYFSALDRTEIEVIITDSPESNDQSVMVAEKWGFKYIKCMATNRAIQMNQGAEISNSDILCFLHADVLPPKFFIRDIVESIHAGFTFGFFAYQFDPSNFLLRINEKFTGNNGLLAGGGDQIHFMTKHHFNVMSGYDESFQIMEDFDFTFRHKLSPAEFGKEI